MALGCNKITLIKVVKSLLCCFGRKVFGLVVGSQKVNPSVFIETLKSKLLALMLMENQKNCAVVKIPLCWQSKNLTVFLALALNKPHVSEGGGRPALDL